MATNLEEVVQLAEQLNPEQQWRLIFLLMNKQMQQASTTATATSAFAEAEPTRQTLLAELDTLRQAGVFQHATSLYGQFPHTATAAMSATEFHAQLHQLVTEWEQELDQFNEL
jgi:hypothetical protein